MTRQNLGYHMRKEILDPDFRALLSARNIDLFSTPQIQANASAIKLADKSYMEVPLVNQYAYAGYLSGFGDQEYVDALPTVPFIVDKQYKGRYRCFDYFLNRISA